MMPPVPGQPRAYPFTCKHCGRVRAIHAATPPRADRVPEGWARSDDGRPLCPEHAWIDLLAIALLP